MKKYLKRLIKTISLCMGMSLICNSNIEAISFVIDPGHGDTKESKGCAYTYDGEEITERDLNLKISQYLKEELQKYRTKSEDAVEIYFTRNGANDGGNLSERVQMGIDKHAEAVISIHNNAHRDPSNHQGGCMALVTSYKASELYNEEEKLAKSILTQLNAIGIPNFPDIDASLSKDIPKNISIESGLLRKLSDDGSTYENGDTTDWYGIVRYGIEKNIAAIIIECAYLSIESDYRNFLSTEEKLQNIGISIAKGIAEHYELVKVQP